MNLQAQFGIFQASIESLLAVIQSGHVRNYAIVGGKPAEVNAQNVKTYAILGRTSNDHYSVGEVRTYAIIVI